MNGLIKIRSQRSPNLYIPAASIKEVSRASATQIAIITESVFMNRTGTFNAPGYLITETGTGGGATDETNVQAIIDAWSSVLRGQQSIATVNFPIPVDQVARAMIAWP